MSKYSFPKGIAWYTCVGAMLESSAPTKYVWSEIRWHSSRFTDDHQPLTCHTAMRTLRTYWQARQEQVAEAMEGSELVGADVLESPSCSSRMLWQRRGYSEEGDSSIAPTQPRQSQIAQHRYRERVLRKDAEEVSRIIGGLRTKIGSQRKQSPPPSGIV